MITCFTASKTKPIGTGSSTESRKSKNYVFHEQRKLYVFDDFKNHTNTIENGFKIENYGFTRFI